MRTLHYLSHFIASVMTFFDTATTLTALALTGVYRFCRDTLIYTFAFLTPMPVFAGGHPMVATRHMTYLTTGVHRRAQPRSKTGPNDGDGDDDGDDDDGAVRRR